MLELIDQAHPRRLETENAIRTVYLREHGAHLKRFPPHLVCRMDAWGIVCAASLRYSSDGFFSDCYLDQPIEQVIGRHVGVTPSPAKLVEVGSLAADRPGDIMAFIQDIIAFADGTGMQWAFFTATARLRAFLRRGGIPLVELGIADQSRVEDVQSWGSYYRQDPRVMLVGKHMIPGLDKSFGAQERGVSHA